MSIERVCLEVTPGEDAVFTDFSIGRASRSCGQVERVHQPGVEEVVNAYRRSGGAPSDIGAAAMRVSELLPAAVRADLAAVVQSADVITVDLVAHDWLAPLPWELVVDTDGTLLFGHEQVVVRRVVRGAPPRPAAAAGPLRTVLLAGPRGLVDPDLGLPLVERNREDDWLVGPGRIGNPSERVPEVGSLEVLEDYLKQSSSAQPADVLVMVTHGRPGAVLLVDGEPAPQPRWCTGSELAKVVAGRVGVVVLVACRGTAVSDGGASVAAALAEAGVPAIAAHPDVLKTTAQTFSMNLSSALCDSVSLHEAFREARNGFATSYGLEQGGLYGAVSLWQPDCLDIRLRPARPASTGVHVKALAPEVDDLKGRVVVLEQIVDAMDHRVVGLVGPPGSGKSRLLRHLVDEPNSVAPVVAALLRESNPDTAPAVLNAGTLTDRLGEGLAQLRGGMDGLARWRQRREKLFDQTEPLARWNALVAGQHVPNGRYLVVIDAIDEIEDPIGREDFRTFLAHALSSLPNGVSAVVSAWHVDHLPRPNGTRPEVVDLGDFQEPEAIAAYADHLLETRHGLGFADRTAIASRIADRAEGVFLYARAVVEMLGSIALADLSNSEALDELTRGLPVRLEGLYESIPHRVGDRWGRVRLLFAVIGACRRSTGFCAAELASILNWSSTEVADLLAEPTVAALVSQARAGGLRLFHPSLADWVEGLLGGVVGVEAHRKIAEALVQLYPDPPTVRETDEDDLAAYHLRQTPRHLLSVMVSGSRVERLWASRVFTDLLNPAFLLIAIECRGPAAVAGEVTEASSRGAGIPKAWSYILADLAARGLPASIDRIGLLVHLHHDALARNEIPLADWCNRELRATDRPHLITTVAASSAANLRPANLLGHHDLESPVAAVAWHPDGSCVAAVTPGRLWIFGVDRGGQLDGHFLDQAKHGDRLTCLAWHPAGVRLAAGGHSGVCVYSADATGSGLGYEPVSELDTRWVYSMAWHPDGEYLLAGCDNSVELFEVSSPRRVAGLGLGCVSATWNVDASLAAMSWRDSVLLFAMGAGVPDLDPSRLIRLEFGDSVLALSWHADGGRLAILAGHRVGLVSVDETVWNDGTDLDVIWPATRDGDEPDPQLTSIAWGPTGARLAIGCANGVQLLELDDQERLTEPHEGFLSCGSPVLSVAWNSSGSRLAAGCANGRLRVFGT